MRYNGPENLQILPSDRGEVKRPMSGKLQREMKKLQREAKKLESEAKRAGRKVKSEIRKARRG